MSGTNYPILEYDATPSAVYLPQHHITPSRDVPRRCVLCFFHEVITHLVTGGRARQVALLRSEIGPAPVYEVEIENERVALFHPGVGAPLAASFLEELIVLGCEIFIACGGAGVLNPEIAVGHLIVPAAAIRDEGTSYHYLPPSREVAPDSRALAAIERTLDRHGISYLKAKTWTTDGLYRETPERVARRRAEGCVTVEMEAAALFAVAQFRGVPLAHILYGGDDVSALSEWNHRGWDERADVRERLLWLAAESCVNV